MVTIWIERTNGKRIIDFFVLFPDVQEAVYVNDYENAICTKWE